MNSKASIKVIAYNLFVGFKRLSCPESWSKHTIGTLRWKMIQVAGRIVSHAGQVILKLAVGIKQLGIFEEIRRKTFEYSLLCSG
ncbi:MAG: transposase [Nitrospirae bacterium YQR-1]